MTHNPTEERTYTFIKQFIGVRNYAPTQNDIAEYLGISQPAVSRYLRSLHGKGLITYERYRHRGITIKGE
ncbi:MAG: helix-turn-helix domain-containing protein [Treponema sp.]|nr:helix-turn-helix domain-containing protein [Treponema sp.]